MVGDEEVHARQSFAPQLNEASPGRFAHPVRYLGGKVSGDHQIGTVGDILGGEVVEIVTVADGDLGDLTGVDGPIGCLSHPTLDFTGTFDARFDDDAGVVLASGANRLSERVTTGRLEVDSRDADRGSRSRWLDEQHRRHGHGAIYRCIDIGPRIDVYPLRDRDAGRLQVHLGGDLVHTHGGCEHS